MKRFSLLLLFVLVAVLLASTSYGGPVVKIIGEPFNFPNINPCDKVQYTPFLMNQGWENGQLVWYICTDASDAQLASQTSFLPITQFTIQLGITFSNPINFAPRLANLAGQVPIVYFVTGQPQPVFTALPGDSMYSGLWQVVFVTFKPGVTRHCVNNTEPFDPFTNPTGLPSTADATFTTTNRAGLPVVVKYPIVAVGPLGGPWKPAPGNTTLYRIPQGKVCEKSYTYTKIIFLPFWNVYCQDPITRRVEVRQIVIPDACDPPGTPLADQLVPKLGANDSPGLCLIDPMDMQNFYWQIGPQPLNQFPILQHCPPGFMAVCQTVDLDYIPVERVIVLQRNVPPLPQSAVITNEPVLLNFLAHGCLTFVRSSQVIDGTVLPEGIMAIPVDDLD